MSRILLAILAVAACGWSCGGPIGGANLEELREIRATEDPLFLSFRPGLTERQVLVEAGEVEAEGFGHLEQGLSFSSPKRFTYTLYLNTDSLRMYLTPIFGDDERLVSIRLSYLGRTSADVRRDIYDILENKYGESDIPFNEPYSEDDIHNIYNEDCREYLISIYGEPLVFLYGIRRDHGSREETAPARGHPAMLNLMPWPNPSKLNMACYSYSQTFRETGEVPTSFGSVRFENKYEWRDRISNRVIKLEEAFGYVEIEYEAAGVRRSLPRVDSDVRNEQKRRKMPDPEQRQATRDAL